MENHESSMQVTPLASFEGYISTNVSPKPLMKERKRNPGDRSRVTRACDRCKRKKTRCSGKQPCALCIRAGLHCDFTAAYSRGRLPPIISETNAEYGTEHEFNDKQPLPLGLDPAIENMALAAPGGLTDTSIDAPAEVEYQTNEQQSLPIQIQQTTTVPFHATIPSRVESALPSSRNSPEPTQTDRQGHYVGPSSGVAFLLRVQKRLDRTVSFSQDSSVFTFGDAPLPKFDPFFCVLPPRVDAERLVARYFDFAVATHRFLHRPTIETWLGDLYDNLGPMEQKECSRERIALLFMVFAQALEYPEQEKSRGSDASARYFQAADHQLSSETGEIRLESIQARLCQCFYVLSQSRVNHCWSLFGTTARLMLALGIHRKRRLETLNGGSLVDLECRKRVFWCAYGLDNYLSAALGRPRTFHDDDIDQDLPTCVDDSDLTPQSINPKNQKTKSIMMACIAHNKLSRIISHVLRDLYSIRPPSLPDRVIFSFKLSEDLLNWRRNLYGFLDGDSFNTSLLIPLFQRQRNVLNLAYYHALILVYRPFLLSNFADLKSRTNRSQRGPSTAYMAQHVAKCLDAAINITIIVNDLTEQHQIFRAFWFTHYFAFSAVVVLYVYTIQQHHEPQETYQAYFEAAAKCQDQISSMAENESLVQRYSVVLEELRLEAIKQTQSKPQHQNTVENSISISHGYPSAPPGYSASETYVVNDNQIQNSIGPSGGAISNENDTIFTGYQEGGSPSSLMAQLTGWGEFDSLVTSGMGALDFTFVGDQTLW